MKVSARLEKGTVLFAVEDTGTGIPEECLPHIFEKFFRVPGRGGQPSNTGLGLAIVKEIIEAHGSKVEVSSQPGTGTRFTFRLNAAERFANEVKAT